MSFLFFLYISSKMESLKTKCQKVLFENINLQKTNDLPKKGLLERTLLLTIEELKKKIKKNIQNIFKNLILLFQDMIIVGDHLFFILQQEKII